MFTPVDIFTPPISTQRGIRCKKQSMRRASNAIYIENSAS
jgi:hypothetical protein